MNTETYKITFYLKSPIAYIDTPTFDGILSYAYARETFEKTGKQFVQKLNYEPQEQIDFSEMPIKQHKNGYFMASSMILGKEEILEDTQRWRKRWANEHDEIADFGKQKRQVDVSRGQFKSYDMPITLKLVDECYFYFKTNNIKEVNRLVEKWIHYLGKKGSQGYGSIASFKTQPEEFDFNTIFRPIPTRFLDMQQFENIKIEYRAWYPPYWLPVNFDHCAIPNN